MSILNPHTFFLIFIVIQLQLYAFSPHPSTPSQVNLCFNSWQVSNTWLPHPFHTTPGPGDKKAGVFLTLAPVGSSNHKTQIYTYGYLHSSPSLYHHNTQVIFSPLIFFSSHFWISLEACLALPKKLHYVSNKSFHTSGCVGWRVTSLNMQM